MRESQGAHAAVEALGSEEGRRSHAEHVAKSQGAGSVGSGEDARRDGDRSSRPGEQLGTEHQPSSPTRHPKSQDHPSPDARYEQGDE